MDVNIRLATLEDFKNIQKLNRKLFELEYVNFDDTLDIKWPLSENGSNYYKNAISNSYSIVAEVDDNVVGYFIGSFNTELDYNIIKQAELDNMYVEEKYRKLGIGKLLFKHFKEECKKKSITEIKVTASFKNRNAIEFYIKNGFEESEITLKQKI